MRCYPLSSEIEWMDGEAGFERDGKKTSYGELQRTGSCGDP